MSTQRTTRPRGFAEWNPRAGTLEVVENAKAVLEEYQKFLPMSIRQIFYRMTQQYGLEKTEQGYKRLVEYIGRARRAGMIPMSAIRDDGFQFDGLLEVEDATHAKALICNWAESFRLPRQRGQAQHLVVWCEAQGMVPMLQNAVHPYGIRVASSGGFDSLTAQHDMGELLAQMNGHVLHLGDFDPSGEHVHLSLSENLRAFAAAFGGGTEFTRVAVTQGQVEEYRLPTAPPKKKRCAELFR